ncbi:MAG: hypothetical protein IMW85_03470 [Thermicanus sp.]|nr:hypothetical protein [Thermicanus sp.]
MDFTFIKGEEESVDRLLQLGASEIIPQQLYLAGECEVSLVLPKVDIWVKFHRETLADIILQVAGEESNRIDYRAKGHRYLIGRTRSGLGIALVWESGKNGQKLTLDTLEKIAVEAEVEGCIRPYHIYASANAAPVADELYRFHQIPDAILARLGILGWDDEEEEV